MPNAKGSRNSNGLGSVTRTQDQRGYVTYRVRAMRDGVSYPGKGVGVKRGMTESQARRLAERNLRDLVRRLDAGDTPDAERDRITLRDWLALWSAQKQDSLPTDTTSWDLYERAIRLHISPPLGHLRLIALRPRHLIAWRHALAEAGRSVGTIRYAEALLKRVLKDARSQEYTVSSAVVDTKALAPEKQEEERPYLTVAGLHRLRAISPEPWRTMWLVAFDGALRFGELAGLRWRHVLWTAARLDVQEQEHRSRKPTAPKKGSRGQVVVPKEAITALREHLHRQRAEGLPCRLEDRVFPGLNYTAVWRVLKEHVALAELDPNIATHAFRHGSGVAAGAADAPLLGLRDQLRHKSLATTNVYLAHRDESGQAEAADRLGRRVREGE